MNIDIKKVEKLFTKREIKLIEQCEISKEDCNACHKGPYDNTSIHCIICNQKPGAINNFERKINTLDKLFIDAPIMVRDNNRDKYQLKTYLYKTIHNYYTKEGCPNSWNYCRLPTVKESPRNVWLAPWLELPNSLCGLDILVWYENNQQERFNPLVKAENNGINLYLNNKWNSVKSIMILENLK